MAKKRKLEVKQKTAGSSESGSTNDKSAKGTETALPSKVPFEGSSSKSDLRIQEDQVMDEEFKPIARKTSDPSMDLPVKNTYRTRYRGIFTEDPPSCQMLRKGVFGAGAAFIFFTGILMEFYYVSYSQV